MAVGKGRRQAFAVLFHIFKRLLDLCDIPVIYGALYLSFYLRFNSGLFPVPRGVPSFEVYHWTFLLISGLWAFIFAVAGLYRDRVRFDSGHIALVVRTVLLATAVMLVAVFFYRDFSYSRTLVLIALVVCTTSVSLFHLLKFAVLVAMHRRGYGLRRVLVIGKGALAVDCFHRLQIEADHLGYLLLGLCGDGAGSSECAVDGDSLTCSCAIPDCGGIDDLGRVMEEKEVEIIFLALEPEQRNSSLSLLRRLEPLGVELHIVPNIYSIITSSVKVSELAGMPVLNLAPLSIHEWGGVVKAAFDRLVAFVGLLLLSPLFAYVAWRIKRESPGPVIYRQERVGLDGKTFTIFKFRSMRCDAEKETGPVWATKDDPRRTPFGEFIRKYSIDELPQLYNVLRGDMSLVGPRPERPFFVEKFRKKVPDYMARHIVKTGITGWAQVNGCRGQCPIEERTRYDIWYIENWSLLLDLRILLRTIYVCIFEPTGF